METSLRQFAALLVRRGFRKTWMTRGGGTKMIEYQRQESLTRVVTVQLWADGGHRVTHSIRGCEDTYPSGFVTPKEMDAAIKHESTRMDNKKLSS